MTSSNAALAFSYGEEFSQKKCPRDEGKKSNNKKLIDISVTHKSIGLGVFFKDFSYYVAEFDKEGFTGHHQERTYTIMDAYLRERVSTSLQRYVYCHLPKAEQQVLMYIHSRTWGWRKEKEVIRKQHFLLGTEVGTPGCGLSRPAIDKGLQGLIDLGFVSLEGRNTYSLNINGINDWLIKKGYGAMMKERKSKPAQKCKAAYIEPEKCKVAYTPYKEEEIIQIEIIKASPSASCDTRADIVKNMKARVEAKTSASIDNAKNKILNKTVGKLTVPDIERFWNMTLQEREVPTAIIPWTGKHYGMVKNFLKTIMPEGVTHLDFFKFAVENWAVVSANHINYYNGYRIKDGKEPIELPDIPDIGFVMSYKGLFLNAFQKYKLNRLRPDSRLRASLEADGYTQAEIETILIESAIKEETHKYETDSLERRKANVRAQEAELKRREGELLFKERVVNTQHRVKAPEKHLPVLTNPVVQLKPKQVAPIENLADMVDPISRLPESVQTSAREMYEANKHWCLPDMVVFTIEEFGMEKAQEQFPRG